MDSSGFLSIGIAKVPEPAERRIELSVGVLPLSNAVCDCDPLVFHGGKDDGWVSEI